MTVYLVGAGPGDPGLLTVRAEELIRQADVVVHDRLVSRSVLARAPRNALLVDVGKRRGSSVAQSEINGMLVSHGRTGATVVRLKGGDPFVFGRGGEEAEALRDASIPFEVIPGVSAAFGVPAAAGIPVTHRGLSRSVSVVTGHEGLLAGTGEADLLARSAGTVVVLMGAERAREIAAACVACGRDLGTPVAIIEDGSLPGERISRTTLQDLAERESAVRSPATIVIGAVASLDFSGAKVGMLAGWRVVVTRPEGSSHDLARALREEGAQVVEVPLIAIEDPEDDGAALSTRLKFGVDADWVVLTSANAVERIFAVMRDARDLGGVKVAAVGEQTAASLRDRGIDPDLIAPGASAASLVEVFPDFVGAASHVAGGTTSTGDRDLESAGEMPPTARKGAQGKILYVCQSGASGTIPSGLAAKGWAVDILHAYRVKPALLGSRELELVAGSDAILFASPSAVRAFAGVRDSTGVPCPPVVACIGPTTAAAARACGFEVAAVAAERGAEGFVRALGEARQRSTSPNLDG